MKEKQKIDLEIKREKVKDYEMIKKQQDAYNKALEEELERLKKEKPARFAHRPIAKLDHHRYY